MTDRKIKTSEKKLLEYIENKSQKPTTLYVDLAIKTVRIICYQDEFIPHLKKQLTYTLSEGAPKYDATIVIWQEDNILGLYEDESLYYENNDLSKGITYITFSYTKSAITLYAPENEIYFYGVKYNEPEEFTHIFSKIFSMILKTEKTNLVHGACAGLNNQGILMCARSGGGKSTLSILSLLEGFEYVSDDLLTLEKEGENLYAYPIYSVITLSPKMYNEMYDKLEGARFVSNHSAQKNKYVLNIKNLHGQFRKKYPIKFGLFLEFTKEENPSLTKCTQAEKGNAITRLVHSTVFQMMDREDTQEIKKLIGMLNGLKFYKISLCNNIYKNVECLRKIYEGEK